MAGIILTDNEYGSQLAKTLNLLRIEQKWTDCCLETRSGKVHVHHIVLAAVVEHLQITSLILSGSKHTFLLKDFNIHIVETFITYLYTGNLHLSSEIDIREFVKLCKHLKFSTLLSHKKFQKYLSSENIDHYSVDISDEDTKLNISETDIKPDDVPYPMYITSNQSFLASTNQIIDNASHVGKSSVPLPHSSEVSEAVPVMSPHPVPTTSSVEEHLIPSNSRSINSGEMTEINTEQSDIEMHIKQEVMSDENYSTLDINTCYEKSQDTEIASVSSIDNQNTQSANELNPEENKNTAKHLTSHLEKNTSSSTLSPSDHKNVELLVPGLEPDKMETSQGEVESVHCTDEIKIEIESYSENTMKREESIQSNDVLPPSNQNNSNVICSECNKVLAKGSLRKHMVTHKKPLIACSICDKKFHFQSELKKHWFVHSRVSNHVCYSCGEAFSSDFNLRRHDKSVHKKQKDYKCDICNEAFIKKETMLAHIFMKHSGKKPYKCHACLKEFAYPQNLKNHKCKGEPKKDQFCCSVCSKMFKAKRHLQQHTLLHSEPKHQCHICGKQFIWRTSLRKHTKSCNRRVKKNDLKCSH